MAEVGAQLPSGHQRIIERQTPSVFPIISFVITGGRDPAALHDYAYYDLRPRISRIPDVSYVTVQGGDIREILVEVEPQALVAAGLSIADIADRLARNTLEGRGPNGSRRCNTRCSADTQAKDPLDLEDRVIVQKNGQPIRLGDMGRVVVSHEDRTMAIRSNGEDAVALTVFRRLGGDALRVSSELAAVLADARKTAPPGVEIHRSTIRAIGAHGDRQRPRRDHHRRRLQRDRAAGVPQKHAGHVDRGVIDSAQLDHQLCVPVLDRRHAEFDVAGRPGRGDRADHRRHGGGDRKHCAASGRRAERRRGGRIGPAAKSAARSSVRR